MGVDVPGAFTLNHVVPSILFLMVLSVLTQLHGLQYWTVLCTPFGWAPSEWGWQAVLAMVKWALCRRGLPTMAQVDNFNFFFDGSTHLERKEREITEVFQSGSTIV